MKKSLEQLESELAANEAKIDDLLTNHSMANVGGTPLPPHLRKKMVEYDLRSEELREQIRKTKSVRDVAKAT